MWFWCILFILNQLTHLLLARLWEVILEIEVMTLISYQLKWNFPVTSSPIQRQYRSPQLLLPDIIIELSWKKACSFQPSMVHYWLSSPTFPYRPAMVSSNQTSVKWKSNSHFSRFSVRFNDFYYGIVFYLVFWRGDSYFILFYHI